MPKELIYSDSPAFVRDDEGHETRASEQPPGSGQAVYRRGVHVGWSRNQHAEIGVGVFSPATEIGSESHYTTLDREGINRLIRSLRKARDAAFGADA